MKKSNLLKAFGLTALAAVSLGLFASNHSVNAEEGTESPKIVFKKEMINTDGYKPTSSDSFEITFEQVENYKKYWDGDWKEDAEDSTVSPKITANLGPVTIAGSGAKEDISVSDKTAYATFTSFSNITKAGLYTYLVKESTPSAPLWTQVDPDHKDVETPATEPSATSEASIPTYVLKVKATNGDSGLQYQVTMKKIIWNKDKGTKDTVKITADSESGTQAVFANRLADDKTNRPKTSVTIYKHVTGDGLDSVDSSQTYSVRVKLTYTPMFDKNKLGESEPFTPTTSPKVNGQTISTVDANYGDKGMLITFPKNGGSVTIPNVPVGTKVEVSEENLPSGFKAKVVANSVDAATDGLVATQDELTPASFMAVSETDATNKNAGSVTNQFNDIVNTGLKFMTSPFVILLAMVVVAGGAYVVAKRKISE